jgi:hypothetical protein
MRIPISTPIVTIAFFSLLRQIKAELTFHNIKLYPYESEEDDEQEQALNESIRVSSGTLDLFRTFTYTAIGAATVCHCRIRKERRN